jgi:hypothetical protein
MVEVEVEVEMVLQVLGDRAEVVLAAELLIQ